jgi:hypothetical protein
MPHCGPPLLDERPILGIEGPLAFEQLGAEPHERLEQKIVDGAEVVVDEPAIDVGFSSDSPCRCCRVTALDQDSFGRTE